MLLNKVKTILSSPGRFKIEKRVCSPSSEFVVGPLFCQSGLFSWKGKGREGSEGASFAHRSHESLRAAAKDTRQTAD